MTPPALRRPRGIRLRRLVVAAAAVSAAALLSGRPGAAAGAGRGSHVSKPAAAADAVTPLPSLAEPAISPDGSEIAFVSGGDIWTVPAAGGTAHLLVSHPAAESRPVYSPDGNRLAFVSNRTGNGDVYLLTIATGELTRLTFDDAQEQLDGWSRDGAWVYFSSAVNDMGAGNADVFRVRADGGTPMAVSAERYTNEVQGAPGPDGKTLALVAGGSSRDWWRNGHSNWNETHVWLRRERSGKPAAYEELTRPGARELWPMWSGDGKTLYCVSDRDGKPQNLVAYGLMGKPTVGATGEPLAKASVDAKGEAGGGGGSTDASVDSSRTRAATKPTTKPAVAYREPRALTQFADGRVLWPSISYDGKMIVFERDFSLWTLDVSGGTGTGGDPGGDPARSVSPQRLNVTLRGSAAAAEATTPLTVTGGFTDLALSPDGRKLAFVAHGEVFAASAREGGRAVRVTHTPAAEGHLTWAPDSRRLVFAGGATDGQNLFLYDFAAQQQTALTDGKAYDSAPRFSPDGKSLLFRRDGTELRLMDLATKKQKVLARGLAAALPPFDDAPSPYTFSPKGQWLAYVDTGPRGYDNVYVIPTTGASEVAKGKQAGDADGQGAADPKLPAPVQLTFFAHTGSNAVTWTPDGRSVLFGTGMRTEDYQLARVDLVARPPNFSEDQFRGLFDEEPRTTRPGGPRPFRPQPERPDGPRLPTPAERPGPATLPADLAPPGGDPATRPATRPATLPTALRNALPPGVADKLDAERFEFDQVRRRISLLPVGLNVDSQVVTPDGKWVVLVGSAAGKRNLYAYPLGAEAGGGGTPSGRRGGDEGDGNPGLRQLTSTGGSKSNLCPSPDGKEVYFLESGQIKAVNLDTREVREVGVSASMEVDFAREKQEVFRQAWTYLKLNFYDPAMHGVDWDAVRKRLAPRVAGAKTSDELRRILALMVGELNASHLGIGGGSGGGPVGGVGKLGVRYDRAAYEADGALKLAEVLTNGPAAQAGLKVGDTILSIDGDPVDAEANVDQLLERKVGRRVVLKVLSPATGPAAAASAPSGPTSAPASAPASVSAEPYFVGPKPIFPAAPQYVGPKPIFPTHPQPPTRPAAIAKADPGTTKANAATRPEGDPAKPQEREVAVRPISGAAERTLLYRDWVEANRLRVAKASKGRLGYVHIPDMSAQALARLNVDLDAESANRQGVVVDVRANLGGFVSPFALDVLARRGYLTMGPRGGIATPGRSYVGQRALDLPTVLVTNGQSISDAEDFTEGYRALKLGKVVGEPTAGGVIFTSDVGLIDGTVCRIPSTKVTNRQGESLEGAGRPVDVLVRRRLGETAADKDTQLDAAVRQLVGQLDREAAAAAAKGKPQKAAKPAVGAKPAAAVDAQAR